LSNIGKENDGLFVTSFFMDNDRKEEEDGCIRSDDILVVGFWTNDSVGVIVSRLVINITKNLMALVRHGWLHCRLLVNAHILADGVDDPIDNDDALIIVRCSLFVVRCLPFSL